MDHPGRPLLDHARMYERLGLRVFPVVRPVVPDGDGNPRCSCARGSGCDAPGKHPLIRGWREEPASIARFWGLGGAWNVGIMTGAESAIVVLDIDPRHGGDHTLAALEDRHGPLPTTWRFMTGGGGEHVVFGHPGGFVKSRANALGGGLDVKADGGFIVAPPSLHVSGRRYAIDPAHHPDHVPLAPLPEWLRTRLEDSERRGIRPERPVRPCRGLSRYGEKALDSACRLILSAPAGAQEATLNSEAYSIGRLAGAGAVPAGFALQALRWAAERIVTHDGARPWHRDELARKVERAFQQGAANPRRVPR